MEVRQLITVRWRQLSRSLEGLSVFHWLLFVVISFGLLAALLQVLMNKTGAAIVAAVFSGLILSLHLSRSDRQFILLFAEKPFQLYFTEYFIVSLPLLALYLLAPSWYLALVVPVALALVALLPYTYKPKLFQLNFSRFLPAHNFEWLAGFRKYGLYILLLYLVALLLVPVKVLSLLLLWLITTAIMAFYQECEPLQLLRLSEQEGASFIKGKLWSHLKLYLLLCLPLVLVYSFFHVDHWFVPFVFLVLSGINLCFFILSKYAFYRPGKQLPGNSVLGSVAMLSSLLPFLILLPLVLNIRFYTKAVANLNYYLYDGD
ncbi:hypothetical protein ACMA1I_21770 [Pontibacter sp. 13R65]|uniref:hypothetical protein n=1 Tax=Pontibacter sp. 13R65 TaxID=3127458 RepID=UPI00301BED44